MNLAWLVFRFLQVTLYFLFFVVDIVLINLEYLIAGRSSEWRQEKSGDSLALRLMGLSGTFIKFGQLLSTRPDVVSNLVAERLERLLDQVTPAPLALDQRTIRQELGVESIDDVFCDFNEKPLAAGSFATVYAATLRETNDAVAIKVRRPRIHRKVKADLVIIMFFSRLVDSTTILRRFRMIEVAQDFSRWTREELDYELEGRRMHWLRDAHGPEFRIPKVYWPQTTAAVLTLERFEGVWATGIKEHADWVDRNVDREGAALTLIQGLLREIFEFGVFHADPHAGNVCLLGDSEVGLIDFGIIGYVDSDLRNNQLRLLAAIEDENLEDAWYAIRTILHIPPDANVKRFKLEFESNIRDWIMRQRQPGASPQKKSAAALLLDNFKSARECGLSFEPNAVRYYRAFLILDHVVTRLAPELSIIEAFRGYLKGRLYRRQQELRHYLTADDGMAMKMRMFDTLSLLPKFVDHLANIVSDTETLVEEWYSRPMITISNVIVVLGKVALWSGIIALLAAGIGSALNLGYMSTTVLKMADLEISVWTLGAMLIVLGLFFSWIGRLVWVWSYRPPS